MEEAQLEQREPLMTVGELAEYLRVKRSWVYEQSRLRKHTGFPVTKVGKYCRFDRERVIEWLRNRDD